MAGIGGMAALAANSVKQKRKREAEQREQKAVASLLLPGTSVLAVGKLQKHPFNIKNITLDFIFHKDDLENWVVR